MKKSRIAMLGGGAVLLVVLLAAMFRDGGSAQVGDVAAGKKPAAKAVRPAKRPAGRPAAARPGDAGARKTAASSGTTGPEEKPAEAMTEEEKREAEEEKRVDEFDAAVDKWMEAKKDMAVTMADIDSFRDSFRRVPKARKDECVHRALNLIPDENVMLLAGILFDKTQDKEILDLVYNDILNRDEDVKKPILKEIFKDREHPNWADTAWILDVTGEMPDGQKK